MPSFHGAFTIPTEPGVSPHNPGFAKSAGSDEAHKAALKCATGMAMLAVHVLTDPQLAEDARKAFGSVVEE